MTAFVKKLIAMITVMAALLQGGAAYAVHSDFVPEDILAKRAEYRFDSSLNDDNDDFDPYACSLSGITIGIDPGHQSIANTEQEPVSPYDESATKDKTSPGSYGVRSGMAEYDINLTVSLKLAELLQAAGAEVILTRNVNDVDISNIERAALMNESGVDFWIRIHCNSSKNQQEHGALILAPGSDMDIHECSETLAKTVLTQFCAKTGADCRGIVYTTKQTGFNWSQMPVVTLEMGYLSNPAEDVLLCRESYQKLCADGIFCGIAAYCADGDKA